MNKLVQSKQISVERETSRRAGPRERGDLPMSCWSWLIVELVKIRDGSPQAGAKLPLGFSLATGWNLPENVGNVANFISSFDFFFLLLQPRDRAVFKLGCQSPIGSSHLTIAPNLLCHHVKTCLRKGRNWLAMKQFQILSNSPN